MKLTKKQQELVDYVTDGLRYVEQVEVQTGKGRWSNSTVTSLAEKGVLVAEATHLSMYDNVSCWLVSLAAPANHAPEGGQFELFRRDDDFDHETAATGDANAIAAAVRKVAEDDLYLYYVSENLDCTLPDEELEPWPYDQYSVSADEWLED